jgi:CheY-like chemotaxis protein
LIRAVLADDSSVQLNIAKGVFKQSGVDVIATCPDGAQAWIEIQRLKPDLAVLDYIMPNLTGAEVAKKIRDSGLKTKIIFATSMSQSAAVFSAEYDAVLIKPFTLAFVAMSIAKAFSDGVH